MEELGTVVVSVLLLAPSDCTKYGDLVFFLEFVDGVVAGLGLRVFSSRGDCEGR